MDDWTPSLDFGLPQGTREFKWYWHKPTQNLHFWEVTGPENQNHDQVIEQHDPGFSWNNYHTGYAVAWPGQPVAARWGGNPEDLPYHADTAVEQHIQGALGGPQEATGSPLSVRWSKLVSAVEEFPSGADPMMKYAEPVPISKLLGARDLERGPGGQHFDRPDSWDSLVQDIQTRGILTPVWLEWSNADGMAYLGEGNTRLAVAQQIGMQTLPVAVYRKSMPLAGVSRGNELGPFQFDKERWLKDEGYEPGTRTWEYKINDGYVPQYFKPHYLIGFLDRMAKTADYQGWSNWETWNTALMIDNEQETNEQARALIEAGIDKGLDDEQLGLKMRDWAIPAIVGPHNQQAIEDAKEWNSIPEDERIDYNYEDFKEKHPDAMDLLHGLVGGPDVGDSEPTLIDPELVNWDEIVRSIKNELEENDNYEQQMAELQSQGLSWTTNHDLDTNRLRDAIYRYHGAVPEEQLKAEGAPFNDPRAYYNRNVTLTPQEFLQTEPHWDNYITPDSRVKVWNLMHEKHPGMPTYERDQKTDWNDPEIQAIVQADPNVQNIMTNGHTQRMHDYYSDLSYAISHGKPHPHIPLAQQALVQRGYSPEEIQQAMRQRWQWNPQKGEWIDLERDLDAAPPIDKSLDQPGSLTIPNEWLSSTRRSDTTWKDKYEYRIVDGDNKKTCSSCSAFRDGHCRMFYNAKVDERGYCTEWSKTWTPKTAGLPDRKVGDRLYFEYHCHEGHDSSDAIAWYHSHQPCTVIEVHDNYDEKSYGEPKPEGWNADMRADWGAPKTYRVRFDDGVEWDVFEDELVDSPAAYYRPEPPAPRTASIDELVQRVRDNLSNDLLHPKYKDNSKAHCYVATEALYHSLGPDAGYRPMRMRLEDGTVHWWLQGPNGEIIDPTSDQFETPPDYSQGRGGGFLTREPSARTRTLMDRMAMAERTGDPTLDKLIDQFAASDWEGPVEWEPVETLRTPDAADGQCGQISLAFERFLEGHGIRSKMIEMTDGAWESDAHFDEMGYGDRGPGSEGHAVIQVEMPSGTYLVDWSASQYGYKEFPMVQRLDDNGGWQRQWTASNDWMADSTDSWHGPQSVDKFKVDVPGEAPGMGGIGHEYDSEWSDIDPSKFRSPCWCDCGPTMPHEWAGTCESGLHPTLPHEAKTAAINSVTLYHGTTNVGWEIAQRQGAIQAREPLAVATQVASTYGLDANELYNHMWFEFSRGRGADGVYLSAEPVTAASYAHNMNEMVEDALRTAFRMTNNDGIYPNAKYDPYKSFREQYYNSLNLQPVVLTIEVPIDAFDEQQRTILDKMLGNEPVAFKYLHPGKEIWGDWTLPEVPTAWVTHVETQPEKPHWAKTASSENWVWIDGRIGWGQEFADIAWKLCGEMGLDATSSKYISNMIARGLRPDGHNVAAGTVVQDYPQIWMSTVDRNAIWDDVTRDLQDQHMDEQRRLAMTEDEMRRMFNDVGDQLSTPDDNPFGNGYGSTGMWQTLKRNTMPTPPWPGPESGFETEEDWNNWHGPDFYEFKDANGNELYEGDKIHFTLLDPNMEMPGYEGTVARIYPEANAFLVRWPDGREEWHFHYEAPNFTITQQNRMSSVLGDQGRATTQHVASMPWKFDLMRAVNQASYLVYHILYGGTPEKHQEMLQKYPEYTNPSYDEWEREKFERDIPEHSRDPYAYTNRYPEWEAQQQYNRDDPNAITPTDTSKNNLMELQFQEKPKTIVDQANSLTNALKGMPPMNVPAETQTAIYQAFMEMTQGMNERAYDVLFRAGLNGDEIEYVTNEIAQIIAGWKNRSL